MEKNINNEKIFAIYSRKSKFTGKGESINNQIEKCTNELKNKYGNKINIKTYIDEGFTGANTNRPSFQKLIKNIKEKKIKVIIVYRLDRISRNVTDFCNLKTILEKYNVDFISVTENFDTSTPLGNAMLMISSIFAQLERDTIAERIKDNMYDLAKTGRWLGGNTPLGYESEKIETIDVNGKKRSLYKLKTIPEEVKIIKLLWSEMIRLKGIHKLETYLINNNIKTRKGNYFTRFSLINIFKNPVYVISDERIKSFFKNKGAYTYITKEKKCGLIAYNKREEKKHKNKDISQWIVATGKHQGIIDSKTFIETWNLLEANKSKRFRTPQKNESILSGIIKCKYCNSYMRPRIRKTYDKSGKINFSYLCELKEKSRKKLCKCKNIDGITTDKIIIQKIKTIKINKNIFIKNIKNNNFNGDIQVKNELKSLKELYNKNKIKINKLIDNLTILDKEIIKDVTKQIKKIKEENITIKKEINKYQNNKQLNEQTIDELAHQLINNYMSQYDQINLIDQRKLIKIIIKTVFSDGENLYIIPNKTVMLP